MTHLRALAFGLAVVAAGTGWAGTSAHDEVLPAEPAPWPAFQVEVAFVTAPTDPRPAPRSVELALSYMVSRGLASPRPTARPPSLAQRIEAGLFSFLKPKETFSKKGSVCGVPAIRGSNVNAIKGKISGCGVSKPVLVTAVEGVNLSTGALMDCQTAKALHNWVKKGAIPAVGKTGGGLKTIHVAAHYSCRTRNNKKGAKISEHGKGRAIDISGFTLANGTISVLKDWGRGGAGKILSKMRKAACGPFGTVLGPGSDRYHSDHFHLDTARYRGGPYCK